MIQLLNPIKKIYHSFVVLSKDYYSKIKTGFLRYLLSISVIYVFHKALFSCHVHTYENAVMPKWQKILDYWIPPEKMYII